MYSTQLTLTTERLRRSTRTIVEEEYNKACRSPAQSTVSFKRSPPGSLVTTNGDGRRMGTSDSVSSTSSGSSGVSTCERAELPTPPTPAIKRRSRTRNTRVKEAVKVQILAIRLPTPRLNHTHSHGRAQPSAASTAASHSRVARDVEYTLIPQDLETHVLFGWKKRDVLDYFSFPKDTGVPEVESRLRLYGPGLYSATKAVRLARPYPTPRRKHQVNLVCGLSGDQPTHVLMVVEKRNSHQSHPDFTVPAPISAMSTASYPERQRQRMFPVHDLVLHMNCGRLPCGFLGRVAGSCPSNAGERITVPTKEFAVPSIAAFSLLLEWMYTKHPLAILSRLLPNHNEIVQAAPEEPPKDSQNDEQWDEEDDVDVKRWGYLASRISKGRLLQFLSMTYATWETVWVLGIDNKDLSQLVDLCWQVLINALQRKLSAEGKLYNFGTIKEGMPGAETILNAGPGSMDGQIYLPFNDLDPSVPPQEIAAPPKDLRSTRTMGGSYRSCSTSQEEERALGVLRCSPPVAHKDEHSS